MYRQERGKREKRAHWLIDFQLIDSKDGEVVFTESVLCVSVSSLSDLLDSHWLFCLLHNDGGNGHKCWVDTFMRVVSEVSGTDSFDVIELNDVANLCGVHAEGEVNEISLGDEIV